MIDILKFIGGPGSIGFLMANIALGLLVWRSRPRWRLFIKVWFVGLVLSYTLLSVPVIASRLIPSESSCEAVPDLAGVPPPRSLVVLDGDNPAGRVSESVRAFRLWNPQQTVILASPWFVDHLADGIARSRMHVDPTPATTRLQMLWIAEHQSTLLPAAVVVSCIQLPRVAALTRALNLTLTLLSSPLDAPDASGLRRWVPSLGALDASRDVIYEHAALIYYRYRGWIAPQ